MASLLKDNGFVCNLYESSEGEGMDVSELCPLDIRSDWCPFDKELWEVLVMEELTVAFMPFIVATDWMAIPWELWPDWLVDGLPPITFEEEVELWSGNVCPVLGENNKQLIFATYQRIKWIEAKITEENV